MRKGKREKYRMQKSHQKEERQVTEDSNLPILKKRGSQLPRDRNKMAQTTKCTAIHIMDGHSSIWKWSQRELSNEDQHGIQQGSDGFQKSLRPCALDESSLSIGRVKSLSANKSVIYFTLIMPLLTGSTSQKSNKRSEGQDLWGLLFSGLVRRTTQACWYYSLHLLPVLGFGQN